MENTGCDSPGIAIAQNHSESISRAPSPTNHSMVAQDSSSEITIHSGVHTAPTRAPQIHVENDSPKRLSDESHTDSSRSATRPTISLGPEQQTRLHHIILKKLRTNAKAVEVAIKGYFGGVVGFGKSLFSRKER